MHSHLNLFSLALFFFSGSDVTLNAHSVEAHAGERNSSEMSARHTRRLHHDEGEVETIDPSVAAHDQEEKSDEWSEKCKK